MTPMMMAALAGIAGLIVGSIITAWIVKRPGSPTSPAALKAELEGYQEDVAEHFAETAALVNKMTDSYKDVFDHLQGGASKLIDEEKLKAKLADQSEEVITLNRLGYTAAGGATTATTIAGDNPAGGASESTAPPSADAAEPSADDAAAPQGNQNPDQTGDTERGADQASSDAGENDAVDGAADSEQEPVQPPAAHS